MNRIKVVSVWIGAVVLAISCNANAKPWDKLDPIEKDILRIHEASWADYSEERQESLIRSIKVEVSRKLAYRNWLNNKLPRNVREDVLKNKKQMNDKDFKLYLDDIKREYGGF